MAFIEKEDYEGVIKENILDDITEFNDNVLDKAEARAIAKMKGYLSNRYDVNAIFSATGTNRDDVVLMHAIDITLYYLHKSINPRKVPQNRSDSYKEAIEWLQGVNELEINPNLPTVKDGLGNETGEKNYIKYGSNPKRTNHI
jgi:phage gp36-like protein